MVRMDSYLLKSLTHGKIRGLAQLCMICIVKLSRTARVHDNFLEWLGTLIYSKLRNGDKSPFKNTCLSSEILFRNFTQYNCEMINKYKDNTPIIMHVYCYSCIVL